MKKQMLFGSIMVLAMLVSGCSPPEEKGILFPSTEESEFSRYGNPSADTYALYLYNDTQKAIKNVQIASGGQTAWSESILPDGVKIAPQDKVQLFLPVDDAQDVYSLRLGFAGGEYRVLSLPELQDMKSIRVKETGQFAYMEYVSVRQQDIVSTQSLEQELWQEAERKRLEEIRRQEEAERKALEEAQRALEEARKKEEEARKKEEAERKRREEERKAAEAAARQEAESDSSGHQQEEENCADSAEDGTYVDDGEGGWIWIPNE